MNPIHSLCQFLGIQTSYVNDRHRLVTVEPLVLEKLITGMTGESDLNPESMKSLQRKLRQQKYHQPIASTQIAWNGRLHSLNLTFPQKKELKQIRLVSENETFKALVWQSKDLEALLKNRFIEEGFFSFSLKCELRFDPGYYRLKLEVNEDAYPVLLIAAPAQVSTDPSRKSWGLFSPLYALRSASDAGIGGLDELVQMQRFTAQKGGSFVGTLPLLASVRSPSRKSFDPSPYTPSSRLFWNEIFLSTDAPDGELDLLRKQTLVDYPEVYAYKKRILSEQSRRFFESSAAESNQFKAFLHDKPEVIPYAQFQSPDHHEQNFHLYVQYRFHEALSENRNRVRQNELAGLYLDFPVGIHSRGFDAHHYSDLFLKHASMGAPPDTFFDRGQNWGTLAPSPQALVSSQFHYYIQSIRNHVQYASLLRLDHVMGLNRLYLIPEGLPADQGTYLRYPHHELYAILCLEAYLNHCDLVGEDLGTVPPEVRNEMDQHRLKRMWIFQLEFQNFNPPLLQIPKNSLTALNTHDLPPFAAFWESHRKQKSNAIRDWLELLKLNEKSPTQEVFQKLSLKLAQNKSEIFITNAEDLWEETEPQNIPGIQNEFVWRKKHRFLLEDWTRSPPLNQFLDQLNEVRR